MLTKKAGRWLAETLPEGNLIDRFLLWCARGQEPLSRAEYELMLMRALSDSGMSKKEIRKHMRKHGEMVKKLGW